MRFATGKRDNTLVTKLPGASDKMSNKVKEPDTPLGRLLKICVPLSPTERTVVLESSFDVQLIHKIAAQKGQSLVGGSTEGKVGYHYTCFVPVKGRLYEVNGKLKGPVDLNVALVDGDALDDRVLKLLKEFADLGGEEVDFGLSLLALVRD